jgi:hypothetical protein
MVTPDNLEREYTLQTAAARYDELRGRDALASAGYYAAEAEKEGGSWPTPADPTAVPLTQEEALELIALSEVIARKACYGRQLSVRSARQAGASWSQIGAALGTSKQAAWEAHGRWIDGQAEQHERTGYSGLDADETAAARDLAGEPERDTAPGHTEPRDTAPGDGKPDEKALTDDDDTAPILSGRVIPKM